MRGSGLSSPPRRVNTRVPDVQTSGTHQVAMPAQDGIGREAAAAGMEQGPWAKVRRRSPNRAHPPLLPLTGESFAS